jgi:hypothetical protein
MIDATLLSINALPPVAYGASAEVTSAPWVMRIDTAYMLPDTRGIWAVTLAYPAWRLGEVQIGPLLGANGSLPGTPTRPKELVLVGGSSPSVSVGARIGWQHDNWWITACPNLALNGIITPGLLGQGIFFPVFGCPPVLEAGYQLTPNLGVALRASYLPIGINCRF